MIRPGAFQNDGGVGQGEQADAHAQQTLRPQQQTQGGVQLQEGRRREPQAAQSHAHGADIAGIPGIAEARCQRRGQGLHHGLQRQKETGFLHAHAAPHLQIEAEKKQHAEKGTVIDKGCQRGQGEDPVADQQADVQQGIAAFQLQQAEYGQQKREGCQQAPGQNRAFRQFRRAEGQGGHGAAVDDAAPPVKGLAFGRAPFQLDAVLHEQKRPGGGQGIAPEQPAPAQPARDESGHRRAAGNTGIDRRAAEAQIAGALARRRGRGQQGQTAGVEHGPAHALHKTQNQKKRRGIHKAAQSSGQGKDAHAPEEDAAAAADVAQAARSQLEHRQPQGIEGPHQAELAGTGPQALAQGRQHGVDPGHHERHEEQRRADGQQQTAMIFFNGHAAAYISGGGGGSTHATCPLPRQSAGRGHPCSGYRGGCPARRTPATGRSGARRNPGPRRARPRPRPCGGPPPG